MQKRRALFIGVLYAYERTHQTLHQTLTAVMCVILVYVYR